MSIKEDIRSGNIKSVYLMWGEENFLKDYYKKALVAKASLGDLVDFNYMEFTSEKPDLEKIDDFIRSYPFMADKKVLYIKNSDIFKKANEQEKSFWQSVFSDVSDFVVIIFSEDEVDKRSALYKAVTKNHSVDEFPFQSEANLCDWIRRYSQSLGKDIRRDAAVHLMKSCSQSMYILKNELDKLSAFCSGRKEITIDDIEKCACKIPEDRVFDMIDSILTGNTKDAFGKYEELKLIRQEPIRILAAIFMKYNQMRKIKLLAASMNARQIAEKTGQKEYFVTKDLAKINRITQKKLDEIIYLCREADHKIKAEYADGWALLDILVAKMI